MRQFHYRIPDQHHVGGDGGDHELAHGVGVSVCDASCNEDYNACDPLVYEGYVYDRHGAICHLFDLLFARCQNKSEGINYCKNKCCRNPVRYRHQSRNRIRGHDHGNDVGSHALEHGVDGCAGYR